MDYEKGKEIEGVISDLRMISDEYGYKGDKPMTDLDSIYRNVNNCVRRLKRVLGENDY
jgi:hypothetical protein